MYYYAYYIPEVKWRPDSAGVPWIRLAWPHDQINIAHELHTQVLPVT